MTDNVKAIVLALIASFSGVVMNVFLKISLEDINVFTSGFLRFFFGLILILPFIFYSKFQNYKTPNFKIHLTRGILNIPMMLLSFSALQFIPLEQIKAISFVTPIIVVILSVIFLKEKIYLMIFFWNKYQALKNQETKYMSLFCRCKYQLTTHQICKLLKRKIITLFLRLFLNLM